MLVGNNRWQVIDSESAEFAFIHDSSEIRYEVTQNCNLTEVGEVFAEQPYAIAVQQGSHLQEEISRRYYAIRAPLSFFPFVFLFFYPPRRFITSL
jgi:hypothetical protein